MLEGYAATENSRTRIATPPELACGRLWRKRRCPSGDPVRPMTPTPASWWSTESVAMSAIVPWMNEKRTTARAFHDADGVGDWRVLFSGAHAYFRVRSFVHGARVVATIVEVSEAVCHFPHVDLRPVRVPVLTASGE